MRIAIAIAIGIVAPCTWALRGFIDTARRLEEAEWERQWLRRSRDELRLWADDLERRQDELKQRELALSADVLRTAQVLHALSPTIQVEEGIMPTVRNIRLLYGEIGHE